MSAFTVGVVMTAAPGREQNLRRAWRCLEALDEPPVVAVVVYDGCYPKDANLVRQRVPLWEVVIPKHEPGSEQPRNVGFKVMRDEKPSANFVLFLDSDMVFEPDLLTRYREAHEAADCDRILVGPYDWMAQGQTEPGGQLEAADIRWESFSNSPPSNVLVESEAPYGPALACFGGNIVFPVGDFARLGGFHPDLYHGRCEDGELGIRAATARVPISLCAQARCWHVWHPVDNVGKTMRNLRDVPLLNQWHPYVEEGRLPPKEKSYQLDPL